MGQVWKIKILKNHSNLDKGMEVEVVKHNSSGSPTESEIIETIETKYKIRAPRGVYGNKASFLITKS